MIPLTVRLVGALWAVALVVIGGFAAMQMSEERDRLVTEMGQRATLLSEGLKPGVEPLMGRPSPQPLIRALSRVERPGQVIAVYDHTASPVVATPPGMGGVPSVIPEVTAAIASGTVRARVRSIADRRTYIHAMPLMRDGQAAGALVVFLDASHLAAARWEILWKAGVRFLVLAVAMSVIGFLMVRAMVAHPLARLAEWTQALRTGRLGPAPTLPDQGIFAPLAHEVSSMATSLSHARAAAETEAALRVKGESVWTEERLKQFVNLRLGEPLFVVSNREPLSHVRRGRKIEVLTPASGLVTAMEPVLRACGGVWVAHGSGDADREVVDAASRIAVPPDDPRYTLRRVWLTPEEEDGYYAGFSNEGLWPLCHIVHTRPSFRPEDWEHYQGVNRKFADALLEEMAGSSAPHVLIQDYHFALLPALVKGQRPDARVAIFWHIPWPNFEAFGICPWQNQLLSGMLGADLIGFHTQYHCNNFLETVERTVEARVDWERFSVTRGEHTTYVKPFPISVAEETTVEVPAVTRADVLAELGTSAEFIGVGVERVDYTKGLPERFRALGRFFDRYPEYRGRVVFVQVAAPSRSRIERYRELQREVEDTVRELNTRLGTGSWRPILYLNRHHEHHEIRPLYQHADFCMVTSLHDGMNLVAKEFVVAREDGDGVLVLSRFTGAARELTDAILVNPYDLDETAEAIHTAVTMPPEERMARMARMRRVVREHNIYRWAGLLLGELASIPEEASLVKNV
jgi:trehalose 6-phosphate synthase